MTTRTLLVLALLIALSVSVVASQRGNVDPTPCPAYHYFDTVVCVPVDGGLR
jgi:hypothetical protein